MKKKYWILGAFILLAVVQIAVSAARIVKWEDVLRTGTLLRFRTEPVDPSDAFRGRYVALEFEQSTVPLELGPDLKRGEEVYARLGEDEEGFARIGKLVKERPTEGNYLKVDVLYGSTRDNKIHLQFPFHRFYLEEEIAPAAEKAYRARSSRDKRDAYVTVRIKNGYGVLEELFVGGKPIMEFLRDEKGAGDG
ncbi:MAG: GDYXXLXY domain-containing protein [PVC group bacterium]